MAGDAVSDEAPSGPAAPEEAPDRDPASRAAIQTPSPVERRNAPGHARPPAISAKAHFPLRYHIKTGFVIFLFIPLLVIPWAATCVLDTKPMTAAGSSYMQPTGQYVPRDISSIAIWMRLIGILNALAAVLTAPVVGGIVSHAAVVFVQRRAPGQAIDARALFDIADAPWTRAVVRFSTRTPFVIAGCTLVIISILVFPLQYGFVTQEEIRVASCEDMHYFQNKADACVYSHYDRNYIVGAYDPRPASLAEAPAVLITRRVASRLSSETEYNVQAHAWADIQMPDDLSNHTNELINNEGMLSDYLDPASTLERTPFFVSAVPRGLSTGVLREHAMRLNSSVTCKNINRADFPATCPGSRPFEGSYINPNETARWCVPGAYDVFPWTASRDRQDISEELYVDVGLLPQSFLWELSGWGDNYVGNFTLHCTAKTSRGYFELGNTYNNNTPGPLLAKWPGTDKLAAGFNDVEPSDPWSLPGDWPISADPLNDYNLPVPGPLTTTMIAMLGNNNWFYPVANATSSKANSSATAPSLALLTTAFLGACTRGLPLGSFGNLDSGFTYSTGYCNQLDWVLSRPEELLADQLTEVVFMWFMGFARPDDAQMGLGVGMFFANEALLVETVNANRFDDHKVSQILTAPGTAVIKPVVPLAGKIVVSVFIGIEVLALLVLVGYIYHVPTFGSRIDASAIAVMGAQLMQRGAKLPAIGLSDKKALQELEQADGLIGSDDVTEQALEMTLFGAQAPPRAEADGTHGDGVSSKTASVDLPNDARQGSRRPPTPPRSRYRLAVGAEGIISRRWKQVYERRQGTV